MTETNYTVDTKASPANGRYFARRDGRVIGYIFAHNGKWYVNDYPAPFTYRSVAKAYLIRRDKDANA